MAMSILWSYGYTNVRSLKGGYTAWTEVGTASAEPDLDGAFGALLASMKGYNALKDMAVLNEMLASDIHERVQRPQRYGRSQRDAGQRYASPSVGCACPR